MMEYPVIDLQATGSNILKLRRKHGLSVAELQNYFGFEYPTAIYKWQKGESLPTVDNLLALSVLFHMSMNEILVYDDQNFCFSQSKIQLSVQIIQPAVYRIRTKTLI